MLVQKIHGQNDSLGFIELLDDEERLYRLPPISTGPVFIDAFDAFTTKGPHNEVVFHDAPTSELELELKHSEHLHLKGTNRIVTQSLWHDDLWRLRVRRPRRNPDPNVSTGPRRYRIRAQYTSFLPVFERRVDASFFHEGFEANWNSQQYLLIRFSGSQIQLLVQNDLADLYDLKPEQLGSGFGNDTITFKSIDVSPVSFKTTADMTSLRFDVGAGPHPVQGGNALYFSLRGQHPSIKGEVDIPGPNKDFSLEPFEFTIRFYLTSLGNLLLYMPSVESTLLEKLNFDVPTVGNVKQVVKKKIEDALFQVQVAPDSGSKFGDFIKPWLVGGLEPLFSLAYAPGAGDQLRPDGSVEPATGELIVRYIGPRPPPDRTPTILDDSTPTGPLPDDGAIPLFDPKAIADELPDPLPPVADDGFSVTNFGSSHPQEPVIHVADIGALSKIDHIVILMQENRSFDQVLGYLRRDRGNTNVDGLLPPTDPEHKKQSNRFANVQFVPQKATADAPKRTSVTAWPSFKLSGPAHESEDVANQMDIDPDTGLPMSGFVKNFAGRLKATDASNPNLRLVMDYFDDTQLPVFGVLAREFAICDHWYTAHAGPTWPNRFVLLSGELSHDSLNKPEEDGPALKTMTPIQRSSLFDLLNKRRVTWRVFEHGFSFIRLFRNFTFNVTDVVPFNDPVRGFESAARSGQLPAVTLIEPDYIDLPPGNDDHPPADMADGQVLINRIVRALIDSPGWDRTLFVITYDEHGGFYDHADPPKNAPPLSNRFTKLGPRVPTFVISPLVERGGVVHTRFDHTSIGATILRRFCGPSVPKVSERMDKALDLRTALTRADSPRPRSEFQNLGLPPVETPKPPQPKPHDRVRKPESKDDFHGFLAGIRMTTGQPPKTTHVRPGPTLPGHILPGHIHLPFGILKVSKPA